MRCVRCSLGEGDEDYQTFCAECWDEIDGQSKPLKDAAYRVLMLWEIIIQARLEEALTDEELEEIWKWDKVQDILGELSKHRVV
jgi:hypothetical protein